ncbi:hypothetical protein QCD79_32145, partial [Pseudomonas quasicaspiana]|nr:hypothetical protein [Pseudomonas quasicaspiana]
RLAQLTDASTDADFLEYSLYGLPLETQQTFMIMVMILKVCWVSSGRPYNEYSRKSASVLASVSCARRIAFISL